MYERLFLLWKIVSSVENCIFSSCIMIVAIRSISRLPDDVLCALLFFTGIIFASHSPVIIAAACSVVGIASLNAGPAIFSSFFERWKAPLKRKQQVLGGFLVLVETSLQIGDNVQKVGVILA